MKTTAALTAAAIRKKLKEMGIKASVTSDNFAGGNSVRVHMEDMSPETSEKVRVMARAYQYGHFDGMNDIYEYSNRREDIPQVKYVQVENRCSDAMRERIYKFAREYWTGGDTFPENMAEANLYKTIEGCGEMMCDMIHRHFSGANGGFWESEAKNAA